MIHLRKQEPDDTIPEPPKDFTDDKREKLEEARMSDDGSYWVVEDGS